MKILITGVRSYAGTKLTQTLLNEGYEIGLTAENITAKTFQVISKK